MDSEVGLSGIKASQGFLLQSPYEYKPLHPVSRSIRVLNVRASRTDGFPDPQLCGTIEHVQLDESPAFGALSYTWGSTETKPPTILIYDHGDNLSLPDSLSITQNCYEALMNLRDKLGDFTIWVDAICINQRDEEEKSHQIALMQEVYSKASQVYIWLGSGNEVTSRASACLNAIKEPDLFSRYPRPANLCYRLRNFHRNNLAALRLEPWAPWILLTCIVYLWPNFFRSILKIHKVVPTIFPGSRHQRKYRVRTAEFAEFLQSPWLERIWTYQEILLSQTPIIVRGRDHMDWEDFSLGVLTLNAACLTPSKRLDLPLDDWTRLILDREEFIQSQNQAKDPLLRNGRHLPMLEYRNNVRTMPNRSLLLYTFWFTFSLFMIEAFRQSLTACELVAAGSIAAISSILMACGFMSYLVHLKAYGKRHQSPACQELPGLVYAALTRKATVERDYNNGLRYCIGASLGETIQRIDPTDPDHEVHQDLAVQLLKATKCGHILTAAAIQPSKDCPSWVPDWTKTWTKPFDVYEESDQRWSDSGATNNSKMDILLGDGQNKTLTIRGKVIAKINAIYPGTFTSLSIEDKISLSQGLLAKWKRTGRCKAGTKSKDDKNEKNVRISTVSMINPSNMIGPMSMIHMINELNKTSKTNTSKTDAINTNDKDATEDNAEQQTLNRMRDEWHALIAYMGTSKFPSVLRSRTPPKTPELEAYANYSKCVVDGTWWLFDAVQTNPRSGDRVSWDIGCAKENIAVGDQIVLLSGVTTPLIVRPVGDGYRLISPVRRLDEAMTGSYWDNGKAHTYEYLNIV